MANTLLLQSNPFPLHHSISPYSHPNPIRLASLKPFINPEPLNSTLKSQSQTTQGINPVGFIPNPNFIGLLQPKCELKTQNCSKPQLGIKDKMINQIGSVFDLVLEALMVLKKPALAVIMVGLLIMCNPIAAWAASGGRISGRAFSRRSPVSSSGGYSVGSSRGSFSHSVPYFAPSPFSGGGGGLVVGPVFGFGVGAVSNVVLIMMGLAAFVMVSGLLMDRTEDGVLTASQKTSVIMLQVGLLGLARSLQSDLNKIAETADTSTPEGLSYVLTETTLALLRHPDYCISAYSFVDVKRSVEDGEKKFNQLSIEERGKFDEETLVNVNNIKRRSSKTLRATGFSNEYIVITILVATEGEHKFPRINGGGSLREALQKLGSIPSSKLMAVEVLWTPQNENDSLSERELLEDYPLLRPF